MQSTQRLKCMVYFRFKNFLFSFDVEGNYRQTKSLTMYDPFIVYVVIDASKNFLFIKMNKNSAQIEYKTILII